MLNGIAITVVGMLTVFFFLGVMVVAMVLLRLFVSRYLPASSDAASGAGAKGGRIIAAAIAAAHNEREKGKHS